MPRRVRMCGGNRVMSSPLNTTVPASERAGNAIDQRRLSRAVRADQAEALSLANIDYLPFAFGRSTRSSPIPLEQSNSTR
jgi:hypothetical protein